MGGRTGEAVVRVQVEVLVGLPACVVEPGTHNGVTTKWEPGAHTAMTSQGGDVGVMV